MNEIRTPLFKVFVPDNISEKLQKTLLSGYIAEGEKTATFTKLVSQYVGNPNTVLVNSCTTALKIAYQISGVGNDTEVITTPLTSIATNTPILELGGKPVWADVDPDTGISDINDIERLINEKTRAIVILHKEGDIAPLDELVKLANKYNVKLIEDAAHAFGAEYKNKKIGNHGDFVCFSFQAIKHITTGDGGALCCKDEEDYLMAKKLKWFGVDHDDKSTKSPWLNDVSVLGYKGNMNDIAATIGIEQMKNVDDILYKYNRNGELYTKLLTNISGIKILKRLPDTFPIYWAYTVLVENREAIEKKLAENGITSANIHPRNDIWSIFKDSKRELQNVDYFAAHELSLPCGWWVDEDEINRIVNIIKEEVTK